MIHKQVGERAASFQRRGHSKEQFERRVQSDEKNTGSSLQRGKDTKRLATNVLNKDWNGESSAQWRRGTSSLRRPKHVERRPKHVG